MFVQSGDITPPDPDHMVSGHMFTGSLDPMLVLLGPPVLFVLFDS